MSYRGFAACVEFDPVDLLFFGHLADLDDIVGFHGDTREELFAAFHGAVDDYVAVRAARDDEKRRRR